MSIGATIGLCVILFITGVAAGYASGLQEKKTLEEQYCKPTLMMSPSYKNYKDLEKRVSKLENHIELQKMVDDGALIPKAIQREVVENIKKQLGGIYGADSDD